MLQSVSLPALQPAAANPRRRIDRKGRRGAFRDESCLNQRIGSTASRNCVIWLSARPTLAAAAGCST